MQTNRTNRLTELSEQLEKGVADIFTSEKYRMYLKTMARFHNYSLNNTLLIYLQKPDATVVASYTRWKALGRQVNKGETGIKIFCPAPYKKQKKRIDPNTGAPILDIDGKPVTDTVLVPAFKIGTIFDISQTDGKSLPSLITLLDGDLEHYNQFFEAIRAASPVSISFENITNGSNGYFHTMENRIAIRNGMSQQQIVKTAIHEVAHSLLDSIDETKKALSPVDSHTREIRAESVAFCVCSYYGLDSGDYSFGYIAGWSKNRELTELKEHLQQIQDTSRQIIEGINQSLAYDAEQVLSPARMQTSSAVAELSASKPSVPRGRPR